MHRSITTTIFCVGLLLGSGLYAQGYGYPPYQDNPYYRQPRYERPYDNSGMELFERAAEDLKRAAYDVYSSRGRINHARKEVDDVQHQLVRGRFSRDEISEAIHAVEHVLDDDALPEPDRDALWQDVQEMRRFRAYGNYRDRDRW
jgi:hypothetical protein